MKINKDLVDAVMMLSFIILVLVGTTDFSDMVVKDITMGVLAVVTIIMVVLRGIQIRYASKHPEMETEY